MPTSIALKGSWTARTSRCTGSTAATCARTCSTRTSTPTCPRSSATPTAPRARSAATAPTATNCARSANKSAYCWVRTWVRSEPASTATGSVPGSRRGGPNAASTSAASARCATATGGSPASAPPRTDGGRNSGSGSPPTKSNASRTRNPTTPGPATRCWNWACPASTASRGSHATGPGLIGEQFLHRSLLPLDQAPIDRVERKEWRERQTDLFDLALPAELDEDDDADGCSPYGCRSGDPTTADPDQQESAA